MTRSDFRTYVKRIFKRTDKDDEINESIDDTLRDMAARHSFEELKAQSYVNTVAAQENYALPSNLLHLHHPIRILQGSATGDSGWPLEFISKEEYDRRQSNPNRTSPTTGTPSAYCIWRNDILLTEIPGTTAWIIEINWGKQITVPSADTDTVGPWTNNYQIETMRWGVLSRLYEVLELMSESDKYAGYYEYGRPIVVQGQVLGLRGGIANMIERDRDRSRPMGRVAYNPL